MEILCDNKRNPSESPLSYYLANFYLNILKQPAIKIYFIGITQLKKKTMKSFLL